MTTVVASKRCAHWMGTTSVLRAWFTHAPVVAVAAMTNGPAKTCVDNMMGGCAKRRLTMTAIAVTTAMTTEEVAIIQTKRT